MQNYLIISNSFLLEQIIYLLTAYKYLILFPLAIVEGPIIAVIAGFLCINGLMDPLLVFPVIVFGDIIGDSICYLLGRLGMPKFLKKTGKRFSLDGEKTDRARAFFNLNPTRTIFLSKITLGIGVAGIYLAGNAKVPYTKFIGICLVTSVIQYIIYLSIGLLFGSAYIRINHYLNYFASITILVSMAIILYFLIKSKLKKL